MSSTTSKIFRIGRNQVDRIPIEMSFDTDTVIIEKQGPNLILKPQRHGTWAEYFADPSAMLSDDFELPEDPLPELLEQ